MRDGRDGFSIFFKVPPMGSTTVPVPEKITEEEYLALIGPTSGGPDGAQLTFNNRRDTLVEHRAVSFDSGSVGNQIRRDPRRTTTARR